MKHSALTTLKFKLLARRLKLPLWQAVGILEAVWLFTQLNARDGDLSTIPAEEIAAWLEWAGEGDDLVTALVETRWLDRCGDKVLVHDWDEHCPNWVKGVKARSVKREVQPGTRLSRESGSQPSSQPSRSPSTQPSSRPGPVVSTVPPNLTQPNPTQPDLFEKFWSVFPSGRKSKKGDARKAFESASAKCSAAKLIEAAAEYAASDEGRGDFVKMPGSWLRGECWTDDRTAWKAKGTQHGRRSPAGFNTGASHVYDPTVPACDEF